MNMVQQLRFYVYSKIYNDTLFEGQFGHAVSGYFLQYFTSFSLEMN